MPSSTLWIQAFSGLGLFLFGMLFLESQMKQAAGRSFKRIVRGATGTPFKSLMTGLGATALFQSSSVVTLMALSLIGAQLMTLGAAVAVIFGANLGTTVTAWIIALVGFKLDIKLLSYVMIGIGGLGGAFAPTQGHWKYGFGILTGFGLLFLGLEGMKESFESFSAVVDLHTFSGRHPYEFALVGLAVTALVQSSSASIAIAQSAVYTHMIGFEAAAAFVVGANVGTTVTAVLGSLGGSADKKRTALAHFVFNISTGATALLLLPPLVMLVQCAAGALNPVIQIALFHTLFNLMGVVLWFPFITPLEKMLLRFFRKKALTVTAYIHNVPVSVPDLALDALEKEVAALSKRIEEFALLVVNIPPPKVLDAQQDIGELLNRNQHNFDIAYDRLYEKIRLHTGAIHRSNFPQVRANLDDDTTLEMAKAFRAPVLIHSSVRDGSLREAADEVGIPVLLYEGGEALRYDEFSIRTGLKGIIHVMRHLGMLPRTTYVPKKTPTITVNSSKWLRSPQSGLMRSFKAPGSFVKTGELLARIDVPLSNQTTEVLAEFDGIVIGRIETPLVYEGDAIFHIASKEEQHSESRLEAIENLDEGMIADAMPATIQGPPLI